MTKFNVGVLLFFLFIVIGFKFHPSLSLIKVTGYDIKGGIFEARNKRKLICNSSFDVISAQTSPETCYEVTITAKSDYHRQNKEPRNFSAIKSILSIAYDAPRMTCNNADIAFNYTNFRHNRTGNTTEFVLTYRIIPKDMRKKVEAHICGENALQQATKKFTDLLDLLTFSEETKGSLSYVIDKKSCCEKQDSHFEACCKARYTLKNGSCVFFDEIDKANSNTSCPNEGKVLKVHCKGWPIELIIVVATACITFVVAVILAAVNVWRRKNQSGGDVEVTVNAEESIDAAVEFNNPTVPGYEMMNCNSFSTNVTESTFCSRASSLNDRPVSHAEMMFDFNKRIPKTAIKFTGTLLGSGQFGRVELANVTIGETTKKCAVKMIRGRGTNEDEKELFHELELLYQIPKHQNVVSLLAGCMEPDSPLYVVVEYCAKGNLLHYLQKLKHRKEYVNLTTPKLSLRWKINRALDICKGMIFLSNNQIIHRDLAARNILLDENDVAKISDFGMAKDVYLRGLYIKETAGFLPVRWMAIEAIESSIYTTKSDMWSFGVLLWELYMDGQSPYPELPDANKLLDYLKIGNRMAKAENCPDTLYQFMLRCWLKKPDDRPPFSQALRELKNIKQRETKRESGISEESDISDEFPVFEEPEEQHGVSFVNYGQSSNNGDIELTERKNSSEETTAL